MKNFETMTIKELENLYKETDEKRQKIRNLIDTKKQDEEDRKKAELALAKQTRQKAVEDAYKTYAELRKAFVKDYGSFSLKTTLSNDNWIDEIFAMNWGL